MGNPSYAVFFRLATGLACGWAVGGDSNTPPHRATTQTVGDPVEFVERRGITGGAALHVGFRSADPALRLAARGRFVIQLLTRDPDRAREARATLRKAGLHGRLSVWVVEGPVLPHASGLARVVLVEDTLGIPEGEFERVLAPMGIRATSAGGQWTVAEKPMPREMDEWPMAAHDPAGTRSSADATVGPPTDVRWLAAPKLVHGDRPFRRVMAMAAAGGRLVTVRPTPALTNLVLVTHCAFSGTLLWSATAAKGQPVGDSNCVFTYPLRGWGHVGIRTPAPLAVTPERVYCFDGAFDAGTGERLFGFEGRPLFCMDRRLWVARAGGAGRRIAALDARTGQELWSEPGTDCVGRGERIFVADGEPRLQRLRAYPAVGGAAFWETDFAALRERLCGPERPPSPVAPMPAFRLACLERHLLVGVEGQRERVLFSFSPADGSFQRAYRMTAERAASFMPRSVSGGVGLEEDIAWCWCAPPGQVQICSGDGQWQPAQIVPGATMGDTARVHSILTAVGLDSGRIVRRMPGPGLGRCYEPVLTGRHAFAGSCDTLGLADGQRVSRSFYRNGCLFGFVPAYGLLYIPPTDDCACYRKLEDVLALEPGPTIEDDPGGPVREFLRRGPAHEEFVRGGELARVATQACLTEPTPRMRMRWELRVTHLRRELPESSAWLLPHSRTVPISAPMVHGDRALLAVPEEHRIAMADLRDPKVSWDFTADARIVGEPAWYGGLCLFGCGDGWVYAVRASDGALAWRNREAPRTCWIMAFDRFESAWPVVGELLIHNGRVYATAGRHNRIPAGGAWMASFDLRSGQTVWRSRIPPAHEPDRSSPTSVQEPLLLDEGRRVASGLWKFDARTGAVVTAAATAHEAATAGPVKQPSFLEVIRRQQQTSSDEPPPATGAAPRKARDEVMLNITPDGLLRRYAYP